MKKWKVLILSVVLANSTVIAAPQLIDKIIAVVNNDVVLKSDIDNMINLVKIQSQQAGHQLPDDCTLRHQIIERLVTDNVILQIGRQIGMQISDQQLDQEITNIATQNHMTLAQMRSHLAHFGVKYNTYSEQIRKEILIAKVRNNEVLQRVIIQPQEVSALAKQIAAQHNFNTELNISYILLPLPENPTQQQVSATEKLANKLVNELRNGAEFSKLTDTYSIDPKVFKYSNIGWSTIKELPTMFAKALITAKKGDFIGPINSSIGFYIIKVNDLRGDSQTISMMEVNIRHILLKPSPILTNDQARQKLMKIANDIKNGNISFTAAAKKFSDDLGSANNGGDLGWSSPRIYDLAIRNALLRLKKGEISNPVCSALGWHLIQLLDIRKAYKINKEQSELAYRLLFNRKFAEEMQTWVQNQRASAYIKILDTNDQ